MRCRCLLVAVAIALLCALPVVAQEEAADTGRFAIAPVPGADPAATERGYFVYELEPSMEAIGSVRLVNTGSSPVTVDLVAVDGLTATFGGSDYAPSDRQPTAAGAWLQVDNSRVTLEPEEERLVEFALRVPDSAAPGQYLAGISAEAVDDSEPVATTATPEADQAAIGFNVRTRYVIGVQVDVPGDWTPSLRIVDVDLLDQPSGLAIGIKLLNDGDVFVKPAGSLRVTDAEGRQVIDAEIQMDTFVTGTESVYPVWWPGAPEPGTYRVAVDLTYSDDRTAAYEGSLEVGVVAAPASIAITDIAVEEVRGGADDRLQYVDLTIAVENRGPVITDGRLSLLVTRDGESVETAVLADSLTLTDGTIEVRQRYLPPEGWDPGTYAFTITLETVDPNTGQATVLASYEADAVVVVE